MFGNQSMSISGMYNPHHYHHYFYYYDFHVDLLLLQVSVEHCVPAMECILLHIDSTYCLCLQTLSSHLCTLCWCCAPYSFVPCVGFLECGHSDIPLSKFVHVDWSGAHVPIFSLSGV